MADAIAFGDKAQVMALAPALDRLAGQDRMIWTWWTVRAAAARLWAPAILLASGALAFGVYASAAERISAQAQPPRIVEPRPVSSHSPLLALALDRPEDSQPGLAKPFDFKSAKPFFFPSAGDERSLATSCLAAAAWYEAGNDPDGQRSVMQVVLNRLHHPSFPKSVCGVVFQGSERTTGCQFTFTCDGSLRRRFPSDDSWRLAQARATAALNGAVDRSVAGATHYHANYVQPWWSAKLERLAVVGSHIFYRWPGSRGEINSSLQLQPEYKPALALDPAASKDKATKSPQGLTASSKIVPDMRGMETLPVLPPVNHTIFLAADPAGANGRWALAALAACSGKADCQVLTYGETEQLSRNRKLDGSRRERPLFVFIRDQQSRMTLSLWDCERAERADPGECLPSDAASMQRLLRDRYVGS